MSELFNNAKFGDKFVARDGEVVYYQRNFLHSYIDPHDGLTKYISLHTVMSQKYVWQVDDDGVREDIRRTSDMFDIVDKLQEAKNEKSDIKQESPNILLAAHSQKYVPASVLMVHDWVTMIEHRGYPTQTHQVTAIPDSDGENSVGHHYGHVCIDVCWYDDDDNLDWENYDVEDKYIAPVILTPKMIVCNGFKTFRYKSDEFEEDRYSHELLPFSLVLVNDHFEVMVKDTTITFIKYVHELQHLMRDCGQRNLANNFKIDD